MKTFTKFINEGCTTADVNQGNALINTGVSNHLTPVNNIVTNVKNLFAPRLGVVASVAEDGVSIKLNSSNFVDKESIQSILYNYEIMRGTCLAGYIMSQGLDVCKPVNIGQFYVVYFCPSDIKIAQPGAEPSPANLPCKEQLDEEVEMFSIIKESEDEEELEDVTNKKIAELIKSKDKVKAAKQLELLVAQEMELPREYYFAGVKDKTGDESIALRWKYTKKRPHGKTAETVRSLMNIFDMGNEGIWVGDFDEDSMFTLPDEVKKLIEHIIEFLGAHETDNPCVFSFEGSSEKKDKDKDKDKDKENNKEDNKEDNKSDNDSDSSKEDDEDGDSRGDKSDDLL